jgi:hypothetical protein
MSTDQHVEAPTGTAGPQVRTPSRGRARARWGRRAVVATATVATVALGGIAFAGWGVTGDGEGTAQAADALDLDDIGFALETLFYPGLTTDGTLTVKNPNPFPVNITDVLFTFTDDDITGNAACTVTSSQVSFVDVVGAELYLGADATDDFVLADVASMGSGAADECQGAGFTVSIEVKAESTVAQ